MNIALFASGPVGCAIAHLFYERNERLACLAFPRDQHALFIQELGSNLARQPVFEAETLMGPETLGRLSEMDLDMGILAWWPFILKPPLMHLPKQGFLNFHPSLLPWGRGKNPNFWSLLEETPFGVTLHWIDEGIDTGDVAFQREISTSWEDTGRTLYEKGLVEIISLFNDNFQDILAGKLPRHPQDLAKGSFHRAKDMPAASEIQLDSQYTARYLLNLLRARTFEPYPAVWFRDGGAQFEVRVDIRKVSPP